MSGVTFFQDVTHLVLTFLTDKSWQTWDKSSICCANIFSENVSEARKGFFQICYPDITFGDVRSVRKWQSKGETNLRQIFDLLCLTLRSNVWQRFVKIFLSPKTCCLLLRSLLVIRSKVKLLLAPKQQLSYQQKKN